MSKFTRLILTGLAVGAVGSLALGDAALAAKSSGRSSYSSSSSDSHYSSSDRDMFLDFSAHYVRDTRAEGSTDTAGRVSIGGMFQSWVGLDLMGLFEQRSQNYMVGADLRFAPMDWFFLKGGAGAFGSKESRAIRLAPVAGTGIMARFSRDLYVLTEVSYFKVDNAENVSFGAGLGFVF